jgi:hypothetical protein
LARGFRYAVISNADNLGAWPIPDRRLVRREPVSSLESFEDIGRYRYFNTNNIWSGGTLERVADPLFGALRGEGLYLGLALGDVTPEQLLGLVPVDLVFTPDPATRATYDATFAEFPGPHAQQADVRPAQRLRRSSSHRASVAVTAGREERNPLSPGRTTTSRPGASGGQPQESRSPCTTSTGTTTPSSSGGRLAGALPVGRHQRER